MVRQTGVMAGTGALPAAAAAATTLVLSLRPPLPLRAAARCCALPPESQVESPPALSHRQRDVRVVVGAADKRRALEPRPDGRLFVV